MSAPLRLAVLGEPLEYTLSPALHRAGLEHLGIPCESEALRVPPARLGETLERLAAAGYRGVNLTHPHKEAALGHLRRVSEAARRARSVNTVSFEADGARGDTTDGAGFLDLLDHLGWGARGAGVVILGAGGAARSLGLALLEAGAAPVTACARRPAEAAPSWADIPGAALVAWPSEAARAALAGATLVVNATPLVGEGLPCAVAELPPACRVVDLVYGPDVTPWVRAARAAGLAALDGRWLLVFQARRSLRLWTGREVRTEVLARAVGWPR